MDKGGQFRWRASGGWRSVFSRLTTEFTGLADRPGGRSTNQNASELWRNDLSCGVCGCVSVSCVRVSLIGRITSASGSRFSPAAFSQGLPG